MGNSIATLVIEIIFYIISVLGLWKMFQKADQTAPFVRALVPFWNQYSLFKISWETKKFWTLLIIEVIACVFLGVATIGFGVSALGGLGSTTTTALAGGAIIITIIAIVLLIIAAVISIRLYIKTSKAFGHGIGIGVLALFFPWIVSMVIGFGNSKYQGPQV